MTCALPLNIVDEERVVRAVRVPQHFDPKKKRLKPAAFRPPAGSSVVSVIRNAMGDDFCKNKAVEILNDHYIGLAAIRAGDVRQLGSAVVDDREGYCGHALIEHGIPAPPANEPPATAADTLRLQGRLERLAAAAAFHIDPSPAIRGWSGPAL